MKLQRAYLAGMACATADQWQILQHWLSGKGALLPGARLCCWALAVVPSLRHWSLLCPCVVGAG